MQIVLVFFYVAGGAYKAFMFANLANMMRGFPRAGWVAVGLFEVVGGLLLMATAMKWRPELTPLGAGALAVETLALAVVDASYSLALTAANPLVWAVGIGLLAAFVAFGRYALSPARTA